MTPKLSLKQEFLGSLYLRFPYIWLIFICHVCCTESYHRNTLISIWSERNDILHSFFWIWSRRISEKLSNALRIFSFLQKMIFSIFHLVSCMSKISFLGGYEVIVLWPVRVIIVFFMATLSRPGWCLAVLWQG